MRLSAAASMVAAGLAVAACSGPRVTNDATIGAETLFTSAASGRDLRTVVVGNPFNVPQASTDAGVVSALQGSFRGIPVNVTTTPTPNTRPQSRLVVALDTSPGVSPGRLCSSDPATIPRLASGTSQLNAILSFCEGPALYAESRGEVERPSSPDDPRFKALLQQMAFVLIPHDNQFIEHEQRCAGPMC